MKKSLFIFALIGLITLFNLPLAAQNSNSDVKIYDKDGLSFNYPASWELADQSTAELQQLKLNLPNSSGLIYITSPRKPISTSDQLTASREGITDRFIENINQRFTLSSTAAILGSETGCFEVKDKKYVGTVIRGTYQNQLSTADILPVFLEHRFVNFVFIRSNNDYEKTNSVWRMLTESVKITTPDSDKLPVPALDVVLPANQMKVIQGKAISLPKPRYPSGMRDRGIRTIPVKVTIDEKGNVIAAYTRPGPVERIFMSLAEQAAKESRFSPTYLCGEPIRVTGIIIYTFDNR